MASDNQGVDIEAELGSNLATAAAQELMEEGEASVTNDQGQRDVSDVTQLEDLPDTADGVSYQNQGTGIDLIPLTDLERVDMIMNGSDQFADARERQFWTLYNKAIAEGTLTTLADGSTIRMLDSGVYLHTIVDGDKSIEMIKYVNTSGDGTGDVLASVHTAYQNSYQAEVLELLNGDNETNSNIVRITTADPVNGVASDNVIELKYPDDFAYSEFGGYVGNAVGQLFADGDACQQIINSSVLKTLGQHGGTLLDFLAEGTDTRDAVLGAINGADTVVLQSRPDIFNGFVTNFTNAIVGHIASELVSEFTDAIDIGGIGGEILSTIGNDVTFQIISEGLDVVFKGLDLDVFDGNFFNGDGIDLNINVANMLAGYAGNRLAGEVIEPESQVAAVFGSIGSAVGSAVGLGVAAGQTLSVAISAAFSTSSAIANGAAAGAVAGPIGVAIGAFIGMVVGTVLGNSFGGEDSPQSWAKIVYDDSSNEYGIADNWEKDGGGDAGLQLATTVNNFINEIISITGGALRSTSDAYSATIGFYRDHYQVHYQGTEYRFDNSGDAIQMIAFQLLKNFDLVGGHAIVMRAWHNSDAENLQEFKEDLEVAEAFQQYLANPTGILAMMMDQPDSALAQSWAAILQRAAELELHLPSEDDFDGGWGEILLAQGVDPSLIPDIDGDSIVLTDPNTGEETIIHHVIGPGYEIVRIEGTDGDDIIQVIVDGNSIAYVDAGAGDDIIEGSDQSDIIIGGAGDDIINGNEGDDWIHGNEGDDQINGNGGDDLIAGGDDNDTLIGSTEDDKIYGGDGDDYLFGGDGMDRLTGGAGNDFITGEEETSDAVDKIYDGDGNDTIIACSADMVYLGNGDDIIYATGDADEDGRVYIEVNRNITGTKIIVLDGDAVIQFDKTINFYELDFTQLNAEDLQIRVSGEDLTLIVQDFYNSQNGLNVRFLTQLDSTEQSDVVYKGFNLKDHLDGLVPIETSYVTDNYYSDYGLCYEVLNGTSGDDFFQEDFVDGNAGFWYGNDGDDTILMGHGNNWGIGGTGNDRIMGGDDIDKMYGGSGNDYIGTGDGDDFLYGGSGNDTLMCGADDDEAYGGDGDDYIETGTGQDIVFGDAGNDTIIATGGGKIIKGGEGNDTIDLRNTIGSNDVAGGSDDDVILGGAGAEILYGNDGNDVIKGSAGSDEIYGGFDNDILFGGTGKDYINGGDGDDTYIISFLNDDQPTPKIAFNENDTDGYAIMQNAAIGVDNMTVALSFQFSDNSDFDSILFNYASTRYAHKEFKIGINSVLGLYVQIAANVSYKPGYMLNDYDEHNLVVSWDGDNGVLDIYDNGSLVGSLSGVYTGSLATGSGLSIAQTQISNGVIYDCDQNFEGTLSQVAVWDRVLTSEEIASGSLPTSDALHDFNFGDQSQPGILVNNTGNGDMQLFGDYVRSDNLIVAENYIADLQDQTEISPPAIVFNENGTDDYAMLQNTSIGTDNMTVAVTYQFSEDSNFDSIPLNYASSSHSHLEFKLVINPVSGLAVKIAGETYKPNYFLNDYDEHTLVVSWNGDNGTLNVYDNEQLIGSFSGVYTGSLEQGGTLTLAQGQSSVGVVQSGYALVGDISNVTIWDRALSGSEITSNELPKADALHDFDFSDQSQVGVLVNSTGNGNMQLSGNYEYVEGSISMNEALEADTIVDSSGNDTLHISGDFDIDDILFELDANDGDNIIVKLLGSDIATIEDYFGEGAIEQLAFDDGSSYQTSNVLITINGDRDDNLLTGTIQSDIFNGKDGADIFVLNSMEKLDIINDLDFAEGDILDISELLFGYDPLTDAIAEFVQITESAGNSYLSVDADGGADNFVQVAALYNITGITDIEALESSGELVTV